MVQGKPLHISPLDTFGFQIGLYNSIYIMIAMFVTTTVLGLVFLKTLAQKIH